MVMIQSQYSRAGVFRTKRAGIRAAGVNIRPSPRKQNVEYSDAALQWETRS